MWIKYVHKTTVLRNSSGNVFLVITEVSEALYITSHCVYEERHKKSCTKLFEDFTALFVFCLRAFIFNKQLFTQGEKHHICAVKKYFLISST